ncbi:MAG: hypothetical protein HZB44_07835 [Actinobacteria bacterium]|nr:hypothetical protein [Actinomycetota bacterium]
MFFSQMIRKGSISLIVAVIGLTGASCNSGDDITTTPAAPGMDKPHAVTAVIEDGSPVTRGGEGDPVEDMAASTRAMQSELRNAAVAEESYFTENGAYTVEISELVQAGFEPSPGSDFLIVEADAYGYCLEISDRNLWFYFDSTEGEPRTGSCP